MRPIRRTRTLSGLLVVLAFALGALTAQVQAGDLFLPHVVTASTSQATPTPYPPGTVIAKGVYYSPSWHRFWGKIINNTPCTVRLRKVTLYLLDEAGLPVANTWGDSLTSVLSPGQRTPFEASFYDISPSWSTYTIDIQWNPTDALAVDDLQLIISARGDPSVTATVRNQLPVRVQSLEVGIVLYGPNRQVIGYDVLYPPQGPLAPGDVLPVDRHFEWWEWDEPVMPMSCAVFAIPSGAALYSLPLQSEPPATEQQ